jgi:hypothetical protein
LIHRLHRLRQSLFTTSRRQIMISRCNSPN